MHTLDFNIADYCRYCGKMRRSKKQASSEKCHVTECGSDTHRSMSRKKIEKSSDLKLDGESKRAGLCKDHYRKFKKHTKEERKLETLGR